MRYRCSIVTSRWSAIIEMIRKVGKLAQAPAHRQLSLRLIEYSELRGKMDGEATQRLQDLYNKNK